MPVKDLTDLNIKKNDVDDFFLNLSENPLCFPNKDFRFQLSSIYQIFEDEFFDTFASNPTPLRSTNFYFFNEGKDWKVFVTPKNNFEFYLKSKGSMFRFRAEYKDIDGKNMEGYLLPIDIIWDYFTGFDDIIEFDDNTKSFAFINELTQVVKTLVGKLYFIPQVEKSTSVFSINYELFLKNKEAFGILKNIYANPLNIKNIEGLVENYLNYIIFKFLQVKVARFKDSKSAVYFTKPMQHKNMLKSIDLADDMADWLDEIYIGKYDIAPRLVADKISDDEFELRIEVVNKETDEVVDFCDIYQKTRIFGMEQKQVINIIIKQLCYVARYLGELEEISPEKNIFTKKISLNQVYRILTQTSYYLQRAKIEFIVPEDLNMIFVPRASINAKVKKNREKDLYDMLNLHGTSSIKLDEILEFNYQIAIGDDKISPEEFEKLVTESTDGLIKYKNKYILIDKNESLKLLEKSKKIEINSMSKLELLHSSFSGQIKEFEFDYDQAFANVLSDINKVGEITISDKLTGTLRPYQENGFKWLYTNTSKGFGSCMADDMGLGKTIQVISLILKLKDENKLKQPIIIVCPTTLVGNWVKELQMFAPSLSASIFHGPDRKLDLKKDIILTTFAILRMDLEELQKTKWGMVVVDEAQNIKNPDTSQTQALKSLKSNIRIAMTGTPVENRLNELWSIFDFINKGYLGSLRDFQKSYAIPIEKFKETQRAQRLKLCVSPFILRRLKTDKNVITDLPDKVVLDEYCYLSKPQAALYEKVLSTIMNDIGQTSGINRRGMIFKLITALKQICNHPHQYTKTGSISKELSGKSEKFISLVKNIVENGEKTLVFTQYKEMGHILEKMVETELNTKVLFFHGSLTRSQRDDLLNEFENNPDTKVMILSLKAGGTGLNLTSATNVIHYDLWWNPAVEDQATDRTYRIGQDKNVMVHRLVTIGTFEEKIDEMIKTKKELANLAVFEGEKNITELTDEEIYNIFSLSS